MNIRVKDLEEGCIISEDVLGLTNNPLVRKRTVISAVHIEVLEAFQIQQVSVLSRKNDGTALSPEKDLKQEALTQGDIKSHHSMSEDSTQPQQDFDEMYQAAVSFYRTEFSNWQAGTKVDIVAIKKMILPLVQQVELNKQHLYNLHHLSNAKNYIAHHSVAVGIISSLLARKIGCDQAFCIQMAMAGVLADVGMAKMPNSLLTKATLLTKDENIEIKKHPVYSYQYVMDTPLLKKEMKQAIYQHHERFDGSGYPKGEKGDQITLYAQIISIADVYHAMTSERLYRAKQSPFKALETILEDEFGKFDIVAVKALQELIGNLAIGTKVELSDGRIAEVIFTQPDYLTRPMVKDVESGEIIDLTRHRKIYIEGIKSFTA
ncbi:HD-GYP domain-containing protein [Jeotgalibacillus soli]|uniref:HD-GYP domain-containing protein n=1 Tax=Jeotgalibacillus soli TaxID=889306 RepID=A0A0C2S590_9BACL|nr:HD-GYP domain-containing protein [Jeotgalibacillus soli]KIL49189.1 hypothetical protein KP78_06570 [Jeotgalibacillus soli]